MKMLWKIFDHWKFGAIQCSQPVRGSKAWLLRWSRHISSMPTPNNSQTLMWVGCWDCGKKLRQLRGKEGTRQIHNQPTANHFKHPLTYKDRLSQGLKLNEHDRRMLWATLYSSFCHCWEIMVSLGGVQC